MRTKVIAALVVMISVVTAAMAQLSAASSATGPSVELLNPLASDQFWQGCSKGAGVAQSALGAPGITYLDANGKLDAQQSELETAVTQKPTFVMLAAVDSKAVVPAVEKLRADGIKVIAFNTAVPDTFVDATVAMDEVATGRAAALQMIKLAQARHLSKLVVLHLVGAVATEPVRLRRAGFDDEMKKKHPGMTIQVIDQVTDWVPEKAASVTENTLSRTKINAVFTESDFLTPFVVPVLKRHGFTAASGKNHLIMGGLGGIPGGIKAIRQGWQDFTLNYEIDKMCAVAYRLGYALTTGGQTVAQAYPAVAKATDLASAHPRFVNDAKQGPSILLTAELIGRANVTSTNFWANKYFASSTRP